MRVHTPVDHHGIIFIFWYTGIPAFILCTGLIEGKDVIKIDPRYFRPTEVDTLLGSSKKAKKELNWQPKTSINKLVKEMVNFDLKKLTND